MGLKKANIKKKTNRAIEMAEARRQEEEKEQARKEAVKAQKAQIKHDTLDIMYPLYALGCAILSVLFVTLGVFSVLGLILGWIGFKRNKDKKDRYFWIDCAASVLSIYTFAVFVMNTIALLTK